LGKTVDSDPRSSVRQTALIKLVETSDSGKALEAGWLERVLSKDSSLLVAAAGLRGLVKDQAAKALATARSLENEPTMVGALLDFYALHGESQDLTFIEKSLLQLRDARSQRQYAMWLKAYNKAVMRLDQKGRCITLYEKLSQHPSGRIRAIAAEQRLDLDSK
ncbi:MAG: hypothetical protein ACKO7X_01335, partial [Bacteroidota bacterium]